MDIRSTIKQVILEIESEAEIFLFGSRARGDHEPDSDWDILVLLPYDFNYTIEQKIIDALFDVELNERTVITPFVKSKEKWDNDKLLHAGHFYKNVKKESVLL